MVYFDPQVLPAASLLAHIGEMMRNLEVSERPGATWSLPVCYDTTLAPDLEDVAARTGLSPRQVIERHSAVTYHVYMLGFLPGQAYMGDVPAELALQRRATPRLKVPPGSLAIATTMTCIFPLETPCGWHVIGRSPVALWETRPRPRALLAPGDKVTLRPVSLREYEELLVQAAEGALAIASGAPAGVAA
jgi:KipI family sensor histidine kinase inhibitor